jgi:biotin operon repressor
MKQKDIVIQLIKNHTADKPVLGAKLAQVSGLSGQEVRKVVNEARQEHLPIGSCKTGYYWARTQEELLVTIRDLTGRAKQIMRAAEGLRACFKQEEVNFDALMDEI